MFLLILLSHRTTKFAAIAHHTMTDPIRQELQSDLHAAAMGEYLPCDYHARPKKISTDEPVLSEAIRLVDHPQLEELPVGWVIDAVRCSDHSISEIEELTRGFEEVLIQVPITESNGVMSITTPEIDDVRVHGFSPATEGTYPMLIDQQLLNLAEPNNYGLTRWTRVIGMLEADPPEELREHIETLIKQSPESPSD